VVSDMDDDTKEPIAHLCTRVGAIMEDASVVALTIGTLNARKRSETIIQLRRAAETIHRLIGAVEALDS